MNKTMCLLDTSAIFTLLEDEEGAERVETLLRSEEILLPFLVLLETYYVTLQEQTEDLADQRYALLKQQPATFLSTVDELTLLTAARFISRFPLSLADALIAAFAARQGAVLVHKDPRFKNLKERIEQEILPYKT